MENKYRWIRWNTVRGRTFSTALQIQQQISVRFTGGDVHWKQYTGASPCLLERTHMPLDINRRLVSGAIRPIGVSQYCLDVEQLPREEATIR